MVFGAISPAKIFLNAMFAFGSGGVETRRWCKIVREGLFFCHDVVGFVFCFFLERSFVLGG